MRTIKFTNGLTGLLRSVAGAAALIMVFGVAAQTPAKAEQDGVQLVDLRQDDASDVPAARSAHPLEQDYALIDLGPIAGVKAEWRCLAEAVYFESRGEPFEGQVAIAEVVLNRVRSKRFPSTVCGVVYQGSKSGVCQFSFACDGYSDVPRDLRPWLTAQFIAKALIMGVDENVTNKATHFHADYVNPGWAKRLVKTKKIGHHIFYRRPARGLRR